MTAIHLPERWARLMELRGTAAPIASGGHTATCGGAAPGAWRWRGLSGPGPLGERTSSSGRP